LVYHHHRSALFSTTTDIKNAGAGETSATEDLCKSDIEKLIAEEHDLSYAKAGRILDSVFDIISEVSRSLGSCVASSRPTQTIVRIIHSDSFSHHFIFLFF